MKTFLKGVNLIWKGCAIFIVSLVYGVGFVAALKFLLAE